MATNSSSTSDNPPTTKHDTPNPLQLVISNITNLIPIKLTSHNYLLWRSLFEPILHAHNLMNHLDVSFEPPLHAHPTYQSCFEKDQMLLAWINATLSKSTLLYVVRVQTAREAWDILNRQYASVTPSHFSQIPFKLCNDHGNKR
ncbi:UBN2_3 domain-containing protein [Cephalotus follicularis]|uniref:UBN2_3 domain-containing protein n=1 Tax=Cephalotus follicularis TaxID=3775 RepID=A0A1Q3BM36_CEPFO|nr:UBN2_3 domain-containing protein [Cephalotus follicularis]